MAYDKVVDSSVLDAGLKAIADAIREKGGTSDNLAFPQAMADAIKAIEEGGGMSYAFGTITPASETRTLTINHGLGVTPKLFVMVANYVGKENCASGAYVVDNRIFTNMGYNIGGVMYTNSIGATSVSGYYPERLYSVLDESILTFNCNPTYVSSGVFVIQKYYWFAFG